MSKSGNENRWQHKGRSLFLLLGLFVTSLGSLQASAQMRDEDAGLTLVREAAEALGGVDEVLAVERMQVYGFGQYPDGFGSGNGPASPNAPQKINAHNDLQRLWDLENERYMERHRGYFQFPFAASDRYAYILERQVLDGDIAFSIDGEDPLNGENASRGGDVRELRMWSLSNNPVASLQAALRDDSTLSNVRAEGELVMVDVTLADGDAFTLGVEWNTRLPRTMSFSGPNHLLGEVRYTTHWSGYVPYQGIKLPQGINTEWDWRDLTFYRIFAEGWIIDGDLPNMAAPASVRNTEPRQPQRRVMEGAEEVVDGIWRLEPGGSTVIEFADHLLIFELGGFAYDDETAPVIEFARTLAPGKPVTHYIASHQHDDHASGLRTAVAEGLTVIAHNQIEDMFREIVRRPAPNFPDQLYREPVPFKFTGVYDYLRLQDEERTLDIYQVIGHNHMSNALFAYDPDNNVMIAADMLPAVEWQWWADALLDNIDHYELEVDYLVSNHMGVMTVEEAVEFLAPGRDRVQENCVARAREGTFRTGCPPFFTRGDWVPGMEELFELPFEEQE